MNKRFFNQQNLTRRLRLLPVLFAMLLMPNSAWAEDYPIKIGDVQVTDANKGNVLGDGETATVVFTPANNTVSPATPATLTLNGATLGGSIVLQSGLDDLTIHLLGENKIQGADYQNPLAKGIKRENGATTGTLTFTTSEGASGTLFFPDVTTPIEGFSNIVYNNGLEWGCDSYYDSSVQRYCTNFYEGVGTNVVLASASWQDCITKSQTMLSLNNGATITFREDNSLGRVLTLSGFTDYNSSICWYSPDDVKIEISGTNSIKYTAGNYRFIGNSQSNISFIKTGTSATLRLYGKGNDMSVLNTPYISGFKNSDNPTIGEGLYVVDVKETRKDPIDNISKDFFDHYITTEAYGLTVKGVRVHHLDGVYKGHKDHILGEDDATVKFTPADNTAQTPVPATLTLNGANIEHALSNAIVSDLTTPLYVHLNGTNSIWSGSYLPFEGATGDDADLVFTTTTDAAPGSLTMTSSHADFGKTTFYTGFNEVQYPENSGFLYAKEDESGNVIITQNQSYGLKIAGEALTKDNVSADGTVTGIAAITAGTVKYTPANTTVSPATPATLTLDNATIIPANGNNGIDYSGTEVLTISLKGSNTVSCSGAGIIRYSGTSASTLTFTKGGTEPCSLQLGTIGVDLQTIGGFEDVSCATGLYRIDDTTGGDAGTTYKTTITSLGGGSGTSSDDPIIIKTAEDLRDFAKLVNNGTITNQYIKLNPEGGELDCNGLTGFEPIGILINSSYNYPFTGKFDGNNCTIKNLTYSTTGTGDRIGFFGYVGKEGVSDTKIEKLTLSSCSFNGGEYAGGIVGELKNGTIENCVLSSCTVKSGNSQIPYAGGIAGQVANGTINKCTFNSGLVDCTTAYSGAPSGGVYAGGIVGNIYTTNSVTISSCTVSSTNVKSVQSLEAYDIYAGGLVGCCSGTVAISGNKVTTTDEPKKISCQSGVDYTVYHCGAIIGEKGDVTTLTNNTYEYDVTTEIAGTSKSGYTQRGVGGRVYNTDTQQYDPIPDVFTNNGAVMDTRLLAMPGESSPVTALGDEGGYYSYATGDTYGILGAPGKPVKITIDPNGNTITDVSVTYGTSQTATITLTKTEDGISFYTISEMPDADDATLNVTCDIAYDLWIGETQVTDANKNHILGEGNTTVTFAVTGNEAAGYVNTLTLNGAALTVPVKVGLDNLTIDIQGSNTITTNTTCIQNTATTGTPSLTFKSTSDVVGSLTLKNNDEDYTGVISESFYSNNTSYYTISRELALIMLRYGNYTSNTNYFTAGEVHDAQLVPSYGVQVNDMQVYEGNSTNVLGDGKVSFDKTTHTLTLNNANGIEGISTTLSTLDIDLVGSNSLYRSSNGSLFESASGDAVTINLKSTGATGALTMETPANFGATLIGENVTLIPVDPIEELSRDVAENKGTLVYGVDYDLSVGGVQVTSVNASNVFEDDETATVVFTPANNTASPATPATLTLNGATIMESTVSGLENLRVVINGVNTAVGVTASTAVGGDKNISFVGGTNAATLTISAGDGESAVSGFASVSYDGAYAAANVPFAYGKPNSTSSKGYVKSHMMGDNSYLNSLTITTVPHYPIWLYTGTTILEQINNTNKNTLLSASGNVSFDGNHTLSLKNSVNCNARIVSGLSELTISVDGDCIIASPDTGSVVRSINASAPLTIEKASGASSASLKLAAGSHTAINAFASLDYTGLILLSEGATYTSGALNDSNNQPLNEAIFTTGLKKPTLQMNYDNDTYSFQNPNGGGTLKYSRYFANNVYPDEENQVDNGTTTFQIFKNGSQYNDPLIVVCEAWVEANGNSSDKLYACRLGVKDMTTTYGGTVPTPEFLPKAIEGVTVSGYSLGDHTEVAATVTEGNITLTGAGRQELDAIFSIPDGVEYIKTSTTETPKATFFLDVKPATPILSKATGSYAGTQTITVTNLTPNATAMYYTYEGEEPENPNAQAFPEGGVDISSSKTLAVYYVASYETETSTEYLYSETVRETYTILEDPELAYKQGETAVTTAEWILGKDENVLPTLYNPYDLAPVTYESNNTDVATVATDGTVTVVGIGTAVITATTAETDVYVAGEASYTLTVKRQLDVSFSTSNEWATYCGTENLAMPEGLKAYQVTAVDGSTVTIGEIGYIPANTAVLLQNVSNNNVWTNIAASAYTGATSTFENNKLFGTASAVDVSTITGGTVYILVNNMFRRSTSGSIPANRGYLVVEPSAVNAGNAPQLSITIGDETTSIGNGQLTIDNYAGEWYSIDGVKLNGQPQKPGLYIKNGKKVFINKK